MKDKIKNIVKENLRFIITVVIIIAVFTIELPFKVYTPGGMIDLNSRVSVDNAFESKGSFGMAYVSVIKGTVPYLALSYLILNWDIVSDDQIKNPNETMAEKEKIDKLNTEESIGNAIISAHNLAKKKVELKSTHSYISYIDELSDTNAELLDEVLEINGHEAKGLESLKKIVETLYNSCVGGAVIVSIGDKEEDDKDIASGEYYYLEDFCKIVRRCSYNGKGFFQKCSCYSSITFSSYKIGRKI